VADCGSPYRSIASLVVNRPASQPGAQRVLEISHPFLQASRTMSQAIYDIPVNSIEGTPLTLGQFKGKVLLVVNVASKCGLTPQYEGLEKLYEEKQTAGLEILGFPANNFKGQEPGSNEEIQSFCSTTYDIKFPLFAKISVVGEDQHPLYRALTTSQPGATGDGPFRERLKGYGMTPNAAPDVLWNFEKFLIGRDGRVANRFSPDTTADNPALLAAIDAELAKAA
jgi:glutathione peroxidase